MLYNFIAGYSARLQEEPMGSITTIQRSLSAESLLTTLRAAASRSGGVPIQTVFGKQHESLRLTPTEIRAIKFVWPKKVGMNCAMPGIVTNHGVFQPDTIDDLKALIRWHRAASRLLNEQISGKRRGGTRPVQPQMVIWRRMAH